MKNYGCYVPPTLKESRTATVIKFAGIVALCFGFLSIAIGVLWIAQAVYQNGGFN